MFEIGNTLREARRRQELDLAACEAATKIRVKYLTAMEEERFEALPEPAYVRGFLRTYADFLGVETRLVMEEYASREAGESDEQPPPPPPVEPPGGPIGGAVRRFVAPRPQRKRRTSTLRWLALGGVLVLALLIWAGVGSNRGSHVVIPEPEPTQARAPDQTPAQPAPRTPVAAAPSRTAATLEVTGVTGTRGSYVQVRRGGVEGPLIFEGTVPPGTHKRWKGQLWIRVGWTPSLQARVNGHLAPLTGGTANFTVDRAGARPAA